MHHRSTLRALTAAIPLFAATFSTQAQSVAVTLRLDTNRVEVGASTVLHVYAQIVPGKRAGADRIFSWYVDLGNTAGSVASFDFERLGRSTSDQDPRTSSSGVTEGANRRGIYDTFLNLAGAGKESPVELFSVPVRGSAPGQCILYGQAGTGVAGLGVDFLVAPAEGDELLSGGDYSAAQLPLEVIATPPPPTLFIASTLVASNSRLLSITFAVNPSREYVVEGRSDFGSGSTWLPLPGAPHNSGTVTDTNLLAQRFYRVRQGN